ncbi:extracellular solute-binding protein, partial [Micromonospora fluostatini]
MSRTLGRRTALRSLAAALATVLTLGVTACTGDDPSGPGVAEAGPEGVDDGSELTMWTRAPLEKQAKLLVDAYNASHQNRVKLTVVPNDDYVAKVGAAAGSGGLPDLFAADIVYVPNWVRQGLFQDLSTNVEGLSFKDSINKGHLSAGTVDGKPHVLPFVLDLSMLFWNKQLFRDAGLDPERAPATLGEYAAAAKAIQATKKAGVYGTAAGLNCGGCLVFTWFPTIWAADGAVLSEDGTESKLADETAQRVYRTWRDLWQSGAVLPASAGETGPTWTAAFTEGKVGLMFY